MASASVMRVSQARTAANSPALVIVMTKASALMVCVYALRVTPEKTVLKSFAYHPAVSMGSV